MRRWSAKQVGRPLTLGFLAALGSLGLGGMVLLNLPDFAFTSASKPESLSAIAPLAMLPAAERAAPLQTLAQAGTGTTRPQARYLLAADLLEQGQAQAALQGLEGLESEYALLAPQILVKRASAYDLAGDTPAAIATWKQLLQDYPTQPEAAIALEALGKTDPRFWDRAIAEFPAHPRTVALAQTRLQQNPDQPQLLLLLARHGLYLPEITQILDRLTQDYAAQLQPSDWEAIAFGYWETQNYGKAGTAYARAPQTPLNAYRAARGWQLGGQGQQALIAYRRMIAQFPQAAETPLALLRLASLEPQPAQALQALDRAAQLSLAQGNTQRVGEALQAKANLLIRLEQLSAARQVQQQLLTTYAAADAAAELRWQQAQEQAIAQDYTAAGKLAEEILQQNPESELAPEAAFWAGKWAEQVDDSDRAKTLFRQLWQRYPHSYYAWRAASFKGLPVGDFSNVRDLTPQIQRPQERLALAAGSEILREIYGLGQNRDAWERWQWEFQQRVQPSFAEQLTDGLLRLGVGDYLDGLFMLSHLQQRSRQKPELRPLYQQLRQEPGYWKALYPLAYREQVQDWAKQRALNPLLVMALMRQESRFQPQIRSIAGAVGLMQVLPETGDWIADQLQLEKFSLERPDDNLKLGTWYLDYTHRNYQGNSMLAIASYNAGPGNVDTWLAQHDLGDPDVFIENIPFPETQNYVKAVFENYWNYLRLYNRDTDLLLRQQARGKAAPVKTFLPQLGNLPPTRK